MERTNRKKIGISNWNEILLENFATSLGASLDVLEQEYDDMIKAFELQTVQLRTFVKYEKPTIEEPSGIEHSPSPTLSDESRSSTKKSENRRRTKIQSSFRVARNNIRRKISNRTMSPCPQVNMKSENGGSKATLSRNDSDHVFGFDSDAYEKQEKKQ